MSAGLTRRAALGALLAAAPVAASARRRGEWPGAATVDVSPLRAKGDHTDADFLAAYLPGYIAQLLGPGHSFSVRIDSVSYGVPGSAGGLNNTNAVDEIEGVGRIDGREIPVRSAIQTMISLPDVGGYQARNRQILLAQSFAQWFVRGQGSWR